ncbi:MAG: M43 family zinc metalloprotease [Chitinophagales bacterium]
MKNILSISFIALLVTVSQCTLAQSENLCGSDFMRQQLLQKHPEILQSEQELQNFTNQFNPQEGQRSGPIIIPVVFHILHRGGSENITDAQVLDQMRILNEDYNQLNSDLSAVIPSFQSLIANIGIEFRLASKDPEGNCTNGIEHIWGSQTYGGTDFCKLNPWPRDNYLNVWVYSKMENGVAGYAYLPGSVPNVGELPMIDGINILSQYIGSVGTSSLNTSRALTHEIGHYLNLKHPWGDTNSPGVACGDDDVNDTPITKGWLYCPSSNSAKVCNPNVIENYQNFMDYSYCSKMFTEGQKTRMLASLNNGTASRSSLWSTGNLTVTGVDQIPAPSCAPICDFSANKLFVCVGTPVTYTDNSYNGDITTRLWDLPGASVSTSSTPSVTVTYSSAGTYPVTLNVVNANGSSTKTQHLVTVKETSGFVAPYYTGFEDPNEFDYWWAPVNVDRDEPKFQYCNFAGRFASKSVFLNTYRNRADMNIDELISPPFNCSTLDNNTAKLSFYYSFATWNSQFDFYSSNITFPDSMVVLASKDCGNTWTKIYSDGTNGLFNAAYQDGYFVPGTDWIFWKKVSANIPVAFRVADVRFRLVVMSSHEANNFYLDDWNVGLAPTGIQETVFEDVRVFPNPFTSTIRIEYVTGSQTTFELHDVAGRMLLSGTLPKENELDLSAVQNSGVYLLTLKQAAGTKTLRLIRQ